MTLYNLRLQQLERLTRELYTPHTGVGFGTIASSKQVGAAAIGGFIEVGRTTLGSASDTITVGSLPDKRYYQCLVSLSAVAANPQPVLRLNGISTTTYSDRITVNDSLFNNVSATNMRLGDGFGANEFFSVGYLDNLDTNEKELIAHSTWNPTLGVATAPRRTEAAGKHAQTTNPISSISVVNVNTSDFAIGSQLVVLASDPADVHTTNFWGEEGSDSGSTLDITLATTRKYIWSQFLVRAGSASTTLKLRVGNDSLDSSNNYAFRQSDDGATDVTTGTTDGITLNTNALAANELLYVNVFMINISSEEKLLIIHTVDTNTGLGATNAPTREEIVAKHVNTSNQDNHIGIVATSGSISATSSQGKSWGGD